MGNLPQIKNYLKNCPTESYYKVLFFVRNMFKCEIFLTRLSWKENKNVCNFTWILNIIKRLYQVLITRYFWIHFVNLLWFLLFLSTDLMKEMLYKFCYLFIYLFIYFNGCSSITFEQVLRFSFFFFSLERCCFLGGPVLDIGSIRNFKVCLSVCLNIFWATNHVHIDPESGNLDLFFM